MPKTLKVDIQEVKKKYPKSGYPCLECCKHLMKIDPDKYKDMKLECWNFDRAVPEADWIVPTVGEYSKNKLPREKMEEWRGQDSEQKGGFVNAHVRTCVILTLWLPPMLTPCENDPGEALWNQKESRK